MSSSRLRMVFDRFDTDGSGAVSIDEMTAMVQSLKLDMKPAELKQLIAEADPDNSGQIEYEEFVSVLRNQLAGGKGGLAAVVTEASSAWGFLNPLTWFAADEPAPSKTQNAVPPPVDVPTGKASKAKGTKNTG